MTSSAEVATQAGVSRSTVSMILNGRSHLFSEATVDKVRRTAETMGYRPSLAGRTLARGKSDVIITLIPDITFGLPLRDFVDLLTEGLSQAGFTNLLRLASSENTLQDAVLGLRPHALVTLAPLSPEEILRVEREGVRVVSFGEESQSSVDAEIGRVQVRHLAARGYDRVVAVRPRAKREQLNAPHRERGVVTEGVRIGLDVLPTLELDLTSADVLAALDSLPEQPIGVACYNDDVALAVLGAAQRLGRKVPEDIGIIGVDNTTIARAFTPPLTTIALNVVPNIRELVRHIVSGEELAVTEKTIREQLAGIEIVAGQTT